MPAAFVESLDKLESLDNLLKVLLPDRVICMDETFLKIEGTPIYIIIATGYKTHKILGLKDRFLSQFKLPKTSSAFLNSFNASGYCARL